MGTDLTIAKITGSPFLRYAAKKKVLSFFMNWVAFTHDHLRQMIMLFFSKQNI